MKQIVKFQDPRIRISRSVFVFALLIALTPGLGFAVDPVAMLEGAAVALLIIGGVFMGIGALFTKVKATKSLGIPAILIGAILFILSVAGFAVQVLGSGLGPGELPPPPPGYVAEWNCNFWDISTSTVGDAHDAMTEYPDTPFVAADGGTPDLNKVIATPAYDLTNRIATEDISVDDDRNRLHRRRHLRLRRELPPDEPGPRGRRWEPGDPRLGSDLRHADDRDQQQRIVRPRLLRRRDRRMVSGLRDDCGQRRSRGVPHQRPPVRQLHEWAHLSEPGSARGRVDPARDLRR